MTPSLLPVLPQVAVTSVPLSLPARFLKATFSSPPSLQPAFYASCVTKAPSCWWTSVGVASSSCYNTLSNSVLIHRSRLTHTELCNRIPLQWLIIMRTPEKWMDSAVLSELKGTPFSKIEGDDTVCKEIQSVCFFHCYHDGCPVE